MGFELISVNISCKRKTGKSCLFSYFEKEKYFHHPDKINLDATSRTDLVMLTSRHASLHWIAKRLFSQDVRATDIHALAACLEMPHQLRKHVSTSLYHLEESGLYSEEEAFLILMFIFDHEVTSDLTITWLVAVRNT